MRAEHPAAILPGYYSDGRTWISVDLDANLPEDLVLDLCDMSFNLVFAKLPKRVQCSIVEEQARDDSLFLASTAHKQIS